METKMNEIEKLRALLSAVKPPVWRTGDGTERSCYHGGYAIISDDAGEDKNAPMVRMMGNTNYRASAELDAQLACAAVNVLPALLDVAEFVASGGKIHLVCLRDREDALYCEDVVCRRGRDALAKLTIPKVSI